MKSDRFWVWKLILLSMVGILGLVNVCSTSRKHDDETAVCLKTCFPNPVDRVVGKQCFCQATIVIKEMPVGN